MGAGADMGWVHISTSLCGGNEPIQRYYNPGCPIFDLRLLKRCLQRTAAPVFGSLDPFSMTEFVVNRLKGAENGGCMASRPALRQAIITKYLFKPGLVDVVGNIFGVWPLVVSYLKETSRKDDGDSLVVRSSLWEFCRHQANGLITSLLF